MFNQIDNLNNFYQYLQNVESFNLYLCSQKESILKSNKKFENILNNLNEIFCTAKLMPAFGVSLHNDTLHALQTDMWLEINFSKKQIMDNLPFDSLLFRLDETFGTNLIRKNNNKYDGRCFYFDFMEKVDLQSIIN